jgi:uncharacterized membrane protein required for colicin V production
MLILFTLVVMLIVAASQYRNGLFMSVAMLIQVLLAGLVAFCFWEPIADELDGYFQDGPIAGYEDCLVLTLLFVGTLTGLRLMTNRLNAQMIDFNWLVQQIGGPVVGLATGYLVAGFLVCVFQTLPLEENFLGFTPRQAGEWRLRRILPSDRVWLALMRHAGAYPLCWEEDNPEAELPFDRCATFDRAGTFELRYERYRRHTGGRGPMPYGGELDKELGRVK